MFSRNQNSKPLSFRQSVPGWECAFTQGPMTERSVGTGNVGVSSRGPRHASGFFACWGESDRGICSAQSQGSTVLFKAAPFPQVVKPKRKFTGIVHAFAFAFAFAFVFAFDFDFDFDLTNY